MDLEFYFLVRFDVEVLLHLKIFLLFGSVLVQIIFSGTAKYSKVPVLTQTDSVAGTASTSTTNTGAHLGTGVQPNPSFQCNYAVSAQYPQTSCMHVNTLFSGPICMVSPQYILYR